MDFESEDASQRKRERGLAGSGGSVEEVASAEGNAPVRVPARRVRVQVLVDVGEEHQLLLVVEDDRLDVSHGTVDGLVPAAPVVAAGEYGPLDDGAGLVAAVVLLLGVGE